MNAADVWVEVLLPLGFTVTGGLIGVIWFLLLGRITLLDKTQYERILDLRKDQDRRFASLETEMRGIQQRMVDISDRLSAIETAVRFGLRQRND